MTTFKQTTERLAEEFTQDDPCCEGRIHHENTFEVGRNSVLPSLEIAVKALRRYELSPKDSDDFDIATEALAAIKERGDMPEGGE